MSNPSHPPENDRKAVSKYPLLRSEPPYEQFKRRQGSHYSLSRSTSPDESSVLRPLSTNTTNSDITASGPLLEVESTYRVLSNRNDVRLQSSAPQKPGSSNPDQVFESQEVPSLDALAVIPFDDCEHEPPHDNKHALERVQISS